MAALDTPELVSLPPTATQWVATGQLTLRYCVGLRLVARNVQVRPAFTVEKICPWSPGDWPTTTQLDAEPHDRLKAANNGTVARAVHVDPFVVEKYVREKKELERSGPTAAQSPFLRQLMVSKYGTAAGCGRPVHVDPPLVVVYS